MRSQQLANSNQHSNPPIPPFLKGGKGGLFPKGGLWIDYTKGLWRDYTKRGFIKLRTPNSRLLNEKGIALLMVLVLSAILLAIMSGLIYMVISGTQISGAEKRYKTAIDAGMGGADITYQFIGRRGDTASNASFIADILEVSPAVTTPATCSGMSGSVTYTGLAAKLLTSTYLPTGSLNWSGCDDSLTIDPTDNTTYDMYFQFGGSGPFPTYDVYSKIIDTIEGNTAPDTGLIQGGVVWTKTEHSPEPRPYYYTVEVDAQNPGATERARLSILYQY